LVDVPFLSFRRIPTCRETEKSWRAGIRFLPLRIGVEMTSVPSVIPNAVRNLVREHNYYVYILTNWNHKVMYVGMTNDLERRVYEHKHKLVEGFTQRYNVRKFVYYEHTTDVYAAIAREKEIKKWRREKKNTLVETMNPDWKDLSDEWGMEMSPDLSESK
jgi:putative endonuclease